MRVLEVELPGARAAFTTRAWGDVRTDPAALGEHFGIALAYGRQVHGSHVRLAEAATEPDAAALEADAILSLTRGLGPMVFTADCLPIVVAGDGTVAAIHAGWRGLDEGVIAVAVNALRALTGARGVLGAAIGPGAGACCYEVGDEVHARFAARGEDLRSGRNLDLKAIARRQLIAAGVAQVQDSGLCTICDAGGLFFSYRREGEAAGRQAGVGWLT